MHQQGSGNIAVRAQHCIEQCPVVVQAPLAQLEADVFQGLVRE
jgi:hypothetical protein